MRRMPNQRLIIDADSLQFVCGGDGDPTQKTRFVMKDGDGANTAQSRHRPGKRRAGRTAAPSSIPQLASSLSMPEPSITARRASGNPNRLLPTMFGGTYLITAVPGTERKQPAENGLARNWIRRSDVASRRHPMPSRTTVSDCRPSPRSVNVPSYRGHRRSPQRDDAGVRLRLRAHVGDRVHIAFVVDDALGIRPHRQVGTSRSARLRRSQSRGRHRDELRAAERCRGAAAATASTTNRHGSHTSSAAAPAWERPDRSGRAAGPPMKSTGRAVREVDLDLRCRRDRLRSAALRRR